MTRIITEQHGDVTSTKTLTTFGHAVSGYDVDPKTINKGCLNSLLLLPLLLAGSVYGDGTSALKKLLGEAARRKLPEGHRPATKERL